MDLRTSVEVLRRCGARRIWLFGSALEKPQTAADIDLACEGVPPERFFRAAGNLLDALRKPVDLVDVTEDGRLARFIRAKGRLLYDSR